jgi:hypothetical protein
MAEPSCARSRSRRGLVVFALRRVPRVVVAVVPLLSCSRTNFDEPPRKTSHEPARAQQSPQGSGGKAPSGSGGSQPVGASGAPASDGDSPSKSSGGTPASGAPSADGARVSSGGTASSSSGGAGGSSAGEARPGGPDARPVGSPDSGPSILTFAVIGDYGIGGPFTSAVPPGPAGVSRIIHERNPDFIITTGDNNYEDGLGGTIDDHIGRLYSDFIGNYTGGYGTGSAINRFWPSLGNHDIGSGLDGYLRYFTLPSNERYYDVAVGPVHLFAVNSDPSEPDGVTSDSKQAQWLEGRLAASTSCFDVVYFHHPPYSSGLTHGSSTYMRWPFQAWGAEVVFSGHEHVYERLSVNGLPYFISGTGGVSRYSIGSPLPESQARFAGDFGALFVSVRAHSLRFDYVTVAGKHVDSFTLEKHCVPSP